VARTILCGVDGSAEAQGALRVASAVANRLGLRLVVAHVSQAALLPVGPGSGPVMTTATQEELRAGAALLEELVREERLGYAEQRSEYGLPAERLADLADEENAELIVVGSRRRGAFKAAFLGSVSQDLIGIARCPVLVVPPGASFVNA
jgi:nucleotide-binding universal stress UspA family protein